MISGSSFFHLPKLLRHKTNSLFFSIFFAFFFISGVFQLSDTRDFSEIPPDFYPVQITFESLKQPDRIEIPPQNKKTIPLRIVFRTGLKTWKKPSIRYLIISVKQLPVLPGFSQQIYPSDVHRPPPSKSKTPINRLINRCFPYPEPGSNRHDIAVIGV